LAKIAEAISARPYTFRRGVRERPGPAVLGKRNRGRYAVAASVGRFGSVIHSLQEPA